MSWWKDFGNAIYNIGEYFVNGIKNYADNKRETEELGANQYTNNTTGTGNGGFEYGPFVTSQATNDAKTAYETHRANKPSDWVGSTANEDLWEQIMNRGPFSYDMNGDALYQQYKDIYTNQANLGMQNAMAQASAMAGGYGSSYSQTAGQQAYAQQMQGLNNVGMDLYDRALNKYMLEGDELYNQYNALTAAEEAAYKKWLDQYNIWASEGDRLYGLYTDSYNNDLNTYNTDKGIAYDEYTREQNKIDADEEWNKMYGDLEFDEEGNVIGGGYYTRKDYEADQAAAAEWEKMYGENGYYTKKNQKELDNAEAERLANRKNRAETGDGSSGETNATRQAVSRIDSELRRNNVSMDTPEGKAAIENEIASLLRNERISEAEANYLIYYYGLDE